MKPDLFHGHEQRDCGEHRTCGGRAWCFDCSEWCSDYAPCKGCEMPKLRAEVEKLTAERDAALTQCTEAERLIRALTDQRDQAMATRDHARAALGFVRALADEWEQVIAENAFSAEWTACLRANLPALRDAIDGGRT